MRPHEIHLKKNRLSRCHKRVKQLQESRDKCPTAEGKSALSFHINRLMGRASEIETYFRGTNA